MKFTYFFLTTAFITICSLHGKPIVQSVVVKIDDLKPTITQEAAAFLHKHGVEINNLPRKATAELQSKLNSLTNQLTNHLHMQHKTEVALEVLRKDLETALDDFSTTALTLVSKKVLPQVVDAFITKLAQEKPVNIAKLPAKMKDEFNQRKALVLKMLMADMQADGRDYVYVSDLEILCHKKFDIFLDDAKYVLISQWGQSAMIALDSLKFVTNTQPFPIQKPKKNS